MCLPGVRVGVLLSAIALQPAAELLLLLRCVCCCAASCPARRYTRMLMVSRSTRTKRQSCDSRRLALAIAALVARLTTGGIYRKSPPSTTTLPPNGRNCSAGSHVFMMSRNVRPTASKAGLALWAPRPRRSALLRLTGLPVRH